MVDDEAKVGLMKVYSLLRGEEVGLGGGGGGAKKKRRSCGGGPGTPFTVKKEETCYF